MNNNPRPGDLVRVVKHFPPLGPMRGYAVKYVGTVTGFQRATIWSPEPIVALTHLGVTTSIHLRKGVTVEVLEAAAYDHAEEYERGRHDGRTDPPGFRLTRDETLRKLHNATSPRIRAYWRGYLVGRKAYWHAWVQASGRE